MVCAREVDHSPRQEVDQGSGQAGSVVGLQGRGDWQGLGSFLIDSFG
jgi:hypothetical protein